MIKIINNIVYIFIFLSILISDTFKVKKNITSLLNTTDIVSINNQIIVSTNGGIYKIEDDRYVELNQNLITYNISDMNIINDKVFLTSNVHGMIQVLDSDLNFVEKIDYPLFDNVIKIISSISYVYAIVQNQNEYFIVQYEINNNQTNYLNTLSNFDHNFNVINDIAIDDLYIYLATDNGLLKANYQDSEVDLFFSTSWDVIIEDVDVTSLSVENNKFAIIDDFSSLFDINTNQIYDFGNSELSIPFDIPMVNIQESNGQLYILTPNELVLYNIDGMIYDSHFLKPSEYKQNFSCLYIRDNDFYFGLENGGVLQYENNSWSSIVPNTIFTNQFDVIELKNNDDIIGIVNHRYEEGQSGGFIYEDALSSSNKISNFYSYESYSINDYPISRSFLKADTLNYWSGNKSSTGLIADGNDIFFINNGIYDPNIYFQYYLDQSNSYNINLNTNSDIKYGALIRLNHSDYNNIQIYNVWNMNNGILDSQNGIYADQSFSGHLPFISLNQLKLDQYNNLYVLNPYCEYTAQSIAIRYKNTQEWFHAYDDEGYIPKEMVIDKYNNIWIGYQYALTLSTLESYSPGGIKMLEIKNIQDENDDRWHDDFLNDLDGINIWSVDIGYDRYNNEILWLLTDVGVQGYILYTSYSQSGNVNVNFQPVNNDFYLSDYTFYEGNKIRVDNQNNVWVTSNNNGLFILLNDGSNWMLMDDNITFENNYILSNNIHDIKINNEGYVYIATDLGISVLETPFSKDVHPSNIAVSPNPFKINSHQQIIITNIPNDSIIKIMNLNGYVVKKFSSSSTSNHKAINWDGKSDNGNYLSTGIYLLTVYSSENNSAGVAKFAIIN